LKGGAPSRASFTIFFLFVILFLIPFVPPSGIALEEKED
jgi:hypothetical protein